MREVEELAFCIGELFGGLAHLKIILEDEHLEEGSRLVSAKLMVGSLLAQVRPIYEKAYNAEVLARSLKETE